ncbi:MAG TPA: hypothetical protein VFL83_02875 [Anaeromyxobacter sp.]|nr:hypothetical protein [Anaeromyxobacter sp.]
MLRVTDDVLEVRRWAEARGGRPCRDAATGRLRLAFAGDACSIEVGWEEFEPAFCASRCVFVYDDAPGARRHFVGATDEARAFLAGGTQPDAQP